MPIFERWLQLRNRVLASPSFQRWAARFPLTRPVANRRARALFDIVAGFVYSQVLFACVRLGVLPMLHAQPQSAVVLALRLDLTPEATERLLRAAASLGLVQALEDGRYALGELGTAVVGNPGIAAMVEHHAMLYEDLIDPVALLRGTSERHALADFWAYAGSAAPASADAGMVARYSALMADSQAMIATDVLDAHGMQDHRCLLDVGGGDGTFLVTAAKRWPHLNVILFDLPAVAERARARFEREGLGERARAVGGDILRDPLPQDADVVSLVRVVHDHDDAEAERIVQAAAGAVAPGGHLLVAEPMARTPGAEPIGDAYFGFYLLAMGSGRARTVEEIEDMLRVAGLEKPRMVSTARPMLTRLVMAQRPL